MFGKYNAKDSQLNGLFSNKRTPAEERRRFLAVNLRKMGLAEGQLNYIENAPHVIRTDVATQQMEFYYAMIQKYGQTFLNDANNIAPPGFIGFNWEQQLAARKQTLGQENAQNRLIHVQNGGSQAEALRLFPIIDGIVTSTVGDTGSTGQNGFVPQTSPQTAGIAGWMYAVPLAVAGVVVGIKQLSKKRK